MIKRTQTFLKQLVRLIDALAVIAAFLSTYFLRQQASASHHLELADLTHLGALRGLDSYVWLLWFILPIWIGTLHTLGAYRELRIKSFVLIAWILLKSNVISLLMFGSMVFLFKLHYVSRTFMVLFFLLSFSFLVLERALIIRFFRLVLKRRYFRRKLLIVGTGRRARQLIDMIAHHPAWGLRVVGLLDVDSALVGQRVVNVKVIGTLDQLPKILQTRVVDEVIFVVPRNWMGRIEQGILYCEKAGIRATVAIDLFNLNLAKAHLSDLEGIPFISFETTPVDEWQLAIKRVGDFFIASILLMILFPLLAVVAILVKWTSPGPIFFRQVRCGLNGRRFMLYKFRSMVANAEARKAEIAHLNEMEGPVFKAANDPRLTHLGKWLRKTSIDELPQLFNVLRSEMSLIGPRPPLPAEVEKYEFWQRRRLSMRPGITGYWQVSGRNKVKRFEDWMKLDLEYIDRWSLYLDMKILFKTIPAVLSGAGAK